MEWLKERWQLAGAAAVIFGGFLKIFAREGVGSWGGWTATMFSISIMCAFAYERSATLQAIVSKIRKSVHPEPQRVDDSVQAFRGLLPFREEDVVQFAKLGRQHDIAALLPALRDPSLRAIVLRGETGSGKTSLIYAGLLPVLRKEAWQIVDVCPETQDIRNLIRNQSMTTPTSRLLIVADQFEEHFLMRGSENLNSAIRESIEKGHAKWLLGIRADFKYLIDDMIESVGGAFQTELLKPRVGYGLRLFTVDEAREVILEVGKHFFEAGTGLQLAQDLSRGGRVLPADIQFVGFEMQQRGIRRLDEYLAAGGRDGIIADSIRSVIEQFPDQNKQADARKLLLSLIDSEHGTRLPEALDSTDLAARSGVGGTIENYCDPFVKRRLILRVADSADHVVRYRLAHDYLVQPIYTAIGHTETDYEKAIRLLALYTGEYTRNTKARIPPYDYRLIQRIARASGKDSNFREVFEKAKPVLRATRGRIMLQRSTVAGVALFVALFLPPVRSAIEAALTRELNSRIHPGQVWDRPTVAQLPAGNAVGNTGILVQYGHTPFFRLVPIPQLVMLCPMVVPFKNHSRDTRSDLCLPNLAMGKFDVTVAQFNAFAAATGRPNKPGAYDLPAIGISWDDANSYAKWLSDITGFRFRLPSGAEWKAVCRSGDGPRSGKLGAYAWDFENAGSNMHLVGRKKSDALGLYDLLGNVEQWVSDWDEDWNVRMTFGGNWTNHASELGCNSSAVLREAREASNVVGFRVVMENATRLSSSR